MPGWTRCRACDMPSILIPAVIILFLVASTSVTLLTRDVVGARLRERVGSVSARAEEPDAAPPMRAIVVVSGRRSKRIVQLMEFLRFDPEIAAQNVIAWKVVFAVAGIAGIAGFFYGRAFLGWPLALLVMPAEALFVARFIFGWERARFQKVLLEQVPDVMALICRSVAAGIPLSEALRSVSREAPAPSREEFLRVVNEVSVGQSLESALWKLYERVRLPEYAFFAVTIGLQAQTGGSLVETLTNLQDLVRKRVALSKRGKALAAEARLSATILAILPFVAGLALVFLRKGFLDFFFYDPSGNRLLLIFFGLLSTGIFVMRQMIRRSLAP